MQNCLRKHRRDKELSQQALAEAVGTTRQTIINIEKGKFKSTDEELIVRIENYFGVVPGTIFFTPLVKHMLQGKSSVPVDEQAASL